MTDSNKKYRIFISAAEPSADSHCAGLITALRQRERGIDFVGVGGEKMASAGCRLIQTSVANAAMIYNAFRKVPHFYKLIRKTKHYLKTKKPDLVIVCDSPAFNFHIAKAAKKAQIKTLFYVAPQLWAWASWRIRKLRKYCDKLACILPFEKQWFEQKGIDAVFVGNPLLDELNADLTTHKKSYTNFDPANAKIALMPGSRNAEIASLWQPIQHIALKIKKIYPNVTFTTVTVNSQTKQSLLSSQIPGFECRYAVDSVIDTALNVDFSIVASGSATLQVAAAGSPMIIMYQSSKILWHLLGRWLLKTKYFSLINILADKELVPEFMPYFTSIEPVVQKCRQLLSDSAKLNQLSDQLIQLAKPLAAKKARDNVTEIVLDMLS